MHIQRLKTFEMWSYRQILRVSWPKKLRNPEVLSHLNKTTEIVDTMKKRKLEYFRHLIPDLTQHNHSKIAGRGISNWRRLSSIKNLPDWFGVTSSTPFDTVMVTNVLKEYLRKKRRRISFTVFAVQLQNTSIDSYSCNLTLPTSNIL